MKYRIYYTIIINDYPLYQHHHTFRFIALNTLARQKAHGQSKYYVNKQQRTPMMKAELQAALDNPDRPEA
jgi:hypothetical protein